MDKFIFDTDTCIYWLKGNENIERNIIKHKLENIFIAVITEKERLNNLFKNILLLLAILFLFPIILLLFLELSLRIFYTPELQPGYVKTHPDRRCELKPNFSGKTYDAKLKINSYGLRDEERHILMDNEAYRIVVFGDSIAFGNGVEMEDTFPKILEHKLSDLYKKRIQVFNLGVPGYNTVYEYLYLKESYDIFKPHLIIFEFTTTNDTTLSTPPGSLEGINRSPIVRQIKDVLRHLYSYDWLKMRYYHLRYKLLFARLSKDKFNARLSLDKSFYADNYQGWIEAQKAFYDIAQFCQDRNTPLLFAVYANNIRLSPSLESDPMYPIIEKVTRSLKAQGIDRIVILDEAFREYAGKEDKLWVRSDDSHFSPLAHKLAANKLFQYIHENRLIE